MKQQRKEMKDSKACSFLSLGLELTINHKDAAFFFSDSTIDKKMQIFQRPYSDHNNEQSQNKNLTKPRKWRSLLKETSNLLSINNGPLWTKSGIAEFQDCYLVINNHLAPTKLWSDRNSRCDSIPVYADTWSMRSRFSALLHDTIKTTTESTQ